jgi:hypothetical protein
MMAAWVSQSSGPGRRFDPVDSFTALTYPRLPAPPAILDPTDKPRPQGSDFRKNAAVHGLTCASASDRSARLACLFNFRVPSTLFVSAPAYRDPVAGRLSLRQERHSRVLRLLLRTDDQHPAGLPEGR